ncbi:MAG: signal peptidase I [Solirubrobacterales bacterium]
MRFVSRITSWAATIVLVAALLAATSLGVAILAGLKPGVVKTGSMEPMLARGTLILVKPTAAQRLKVGDVITFTDPDRPAKGLVTHRIFKIEQEKGQPVFTTKGDANPVPDTWRLKLQKDAGLLKLDLPQVGHLSFLVRSKTGYLLMLGIPVLLLSLMALIKIWMPKPEESEPDTADDPGTQSAVSYPRFGYPTEIGPEDELPPHLALHSTLYDAPPGALQRVQNG